jgi:hypothetical protein
MRRETKCGKLQESGVQEFRSYRMVLRITVLPPVVNFLACASDSSGESSPPELLQLRNSCHSFLSRSCTNVFSGIGIKLGDRSLLGGLLDIVNVIPNDLLRLRVVDHH